MEKLKKNKDFQNIYKSGKKLYGNLSIIFFCKNNLKYNRLGFVASKKIGNAVCRNRAKRLFREYYRSIEKNLSIVGYDFIFVSKRKFGENFKEISYQEMKKDIDKIFSKSNFFKN